MQSSLVHLKEHVDVNKLPERQRRIYAYLKDNPVAVLSTCDPNTGPHGTVIYFDVKPNLDIHFLTRVQTQKHENLLHDDRVMLTVYEPISQTTAQVSGRAVEIRDDYEINGIAGTILARSLKLSGGGLLPITKLRAGPYTAYKVEPSQVRMAMYANAEPGDYEALFDSIESYELNEG